MTPYIGQSLLAVAVFIRLIPFIKECSLKQIKAFHTSQLILIVMSFLWLVLAHLRSDFSLLNVVMHSHTDKPWLYKLSGVWGNHEGSMLLWVMLQAIWGFFAFRTFSSPKPALICLMLNTAFILFLIFACDPFTPMAIIPEQGQDLNPLLQDPLLAIHPPCLYLGYVGTSVPFILLLTTATISDYGKQLRAWTLLAWTFLIAGLALGSFWAYFELGWGGWWFWDPVENAALVPWLLLTALLHMLKLPESVLKSYERRLRLLVLATYASCLLGTYLVRSGALTSVHSFAVDVERSLMLLILCSFVLLPGFILAFKKKGDLELPLQPKTWIKFVILGVSLLSFCGLVVAFGTIYPIILNLFSAPLTVGARFYQTTVLPMMQPVLVLMAVTPWLLLPKQNKQELISAALLTGFTLVGLWELGYLQGILQTIALMGSSFLFYSLLFLSRRVNRSSSRQRMLIAHGGLAIAVLGMVLSTTLESEKLVALKPGETISFADHSLNFAGVKEIAGPNYAAQQATLSIDGKYTLEPQKRFYWTQGIIHGETAVHSSLLDHFYVALGDEYQSGHWSLRLYYKPYLNFLWLGALLMVIAGFWRWPRRAGLIVLYLMSQSTQALEPHEQLTNPALEKRPVILGSQLLCPSCAGQILNDSVSEDAAHLRVEVRKLLQAGKTDTEIFTLFVERYGDQVLREPAWSIRTYWLWGIPWLGFIGLIGLWLYQGIRQKRLLAPHKF